MYWTYLLNSKSKEILTFESIDSTNLLNIIIGYDELIREEFFTSFRGYDIIFISEYNPTENPIDKEFKYKANTTFSKIRCVK